MTNNTNASNNNINNPVDNNFDKKVFDLNNNVLFVPTSHIASQSINNIKSSFLSFKPDIVCVELDNNRLNALLSNKKPDYSLKLIPRIGLKGYLFAVIGGFLQRKLGRMVGVQPGADMKQAAVLAINNQVPLVLLDRDLSVTLSRLSKAITFKEKLNFVNDLLFGWFRKRKKISFDLTSVPSDNLIISMMNKLKIRYPSFYRVLLDERNHFMAKKLASLIFSNPDKKIMVVIGAGHEAGLREALNYYLFRINLNGSL